MLGFLGTLARIFAPVVKTVQKIVQAAQTAVQKAVQTVQSGSASQTQSTQRRSSSTTRSQSDFSEQAQRREQQRQRELQRRDVGRDISQRQLDWDTPLNPSAAIRALPSELTVLATGSRLAQDMLLALKHEGQPENVSDEAWMRRFASNGWDEQKTEQASKVQESWKNRLQYLPLKVTKANGYPDLKQIASVPPDPCADKIGDELTNCQLRQQLNVYGVGILDKVDPSVTELHGVANIEQFSPAQLAVILAGVQATGLKLSQYMSTIVGHDVTPAEAFKAVYGSLEFGYEPERNGTAQTIKTGDPTQANNAIYILLDDDSFDKTVSGKVVFNKLPQDFVIGHELGHAFANRVGGTPDSGLPHITGSDYVKATGAQWYPGGGQTTASAIPGYGPLVRLISDGKEQVDSSNRPLYEIPGGLYIPGEVRNLPTSQYFPNENRPGSNPSEGFADTFANFVLDPEVIPPEHGDYFTKNIQQWVDNIICPEGNCNEPPNTEVSPKRF